MKLKLSAKLLFSTFLVTLFLSQQINAQIFLSTNFKNAYDKQTRSLYGTPGVKYWQNFSDYKIEVEVVPEKKTIIGNAEIVYHNLSPDSLNMIVMKLYQNLYKKGVLRNFSLSEEDIDSGINIIEISLNKEVCTADSDNQFSLQGTNLILYPKSKIAPSSNCTINVSWEFTLPSRSRVRMGVYDSTSFFVAYWYPQIAVYDDINGWELLPFTGEQEFYNDFNNYEVNIKVPNNIGVWATGEIQNIEELLKPAFLNRYKNAKVSDSVVNIIKAEDYLENNPFNEFDNFNTWKFKATSVTDFAFATSSHYLWDACIYKSKNNELKSVFISAVYNKNSKDFYEVAKISKEAIEFFESKSPAYPFPYPNMTIYNGDGGMEFPMMVNDGTTGSRAATVGLTSHEIAHSYFPFMMGTNEKLYAWMDESWAVMLPFELQELNGGNQLANNVAAYNDFAGNESEVPPIVPSFQLRGRSYRMAAYTRPALSYFFLKDMIGDSLFYSALHQYMNDWKGKHPTPYDFFFSMNTKIGEDLSWYWKPWFFEYGVPDLAIKSVTKSENKIKISINKIGNIPVPISLTVYTKADTLLFNENASVWKSKSEHNFEFDIKEEIIRIELGNPKIPDVDKSNNIYMFK
jgi:hypothetical protein